MEQGKNIQQELEAVAPMLQPVGRQMPYQMPDGYFDSFPLEMLRKAAGPLQNTEVPEAYFETLPLEILLKVAAPPQQASVPTGYFDELPNLMLERVRQLGSEPAVEEDESSSLLDSIGKKTPYTVPEGYFNQPVIIPQKETEERATAPAVSIKGTRRMWSWAVAACAIVLAGFFAWQIIQQPNTNGGTMAQNESGADSVAMAELAMALASLEENTLNSELDKKGVPADAQIAVLYLNTDNFENALRGLTDTELMDYLEEMGG